MIAQNNSQVSEGGMTGITVKPGQDSIHELIIGKWSVNFWLQFLVNDGMENISMDEISI